MTGTTNARERERERERERREREREGIIPTKPMLPAMATTGEIHQTSGSTHLTSRSFVAKPHHTLSQKPMKRTHGFWAPTHTIQSKHAISKCMHARTHARTVEQQRDDGLIEVSSDGKSLQGRVDGGRRHRRRRRKYGRGRRRRNRRRMHCCRRSRGQREGWRRRNYCVCLLVVQQFGLALLSLRQELLEGFSGRCLRRHNGTGRRRRRRWHAG